MSDETSGSRFELISAGNPPMVDVTAEQTLTEDELVALYPEMETKDGSKIIVTDPSHDQTHGDDTGDIDAGEFVEEIETADDEEPTHKCQSCGTSQRIDTPYASLDAWCESCDGVRTHTEIDE